MPRYRATTTFIFDIESDLPYEEVCTQAQHQVDANLASIGVLKSHCRLEKLREKILPIQLAKFDPQEVLSKINKSDERLSYQVGETVYQVRMNSHRYFIFRENLKCVACGLEGTQMILELNPNHKSPHFNLYAVENGKLVLMTKDHVMPKAVGGEDRMENFVTMCCICNNLKSSLPITCEQLRKLRNVYNLNKNLSKKDLSKLIRVTSAQFVEENKVNVVDHVRSFLPGTMCPEVTSLSHEHPDAAAEGQVANHPDPDCIAAGT